MAVRDATPGPTLGAVAQRPSLREEAIRTLQAAIVAGELRPGIVYSAPTLGAQLGMSATPVREAMLDMVKEGLVEAVPNKGFRVVALSDAELDELTELRLLVEVPSVGRVAARGLSTSEHAALRKLTVLIERAARRGDLITHNRADLEFHTGLLALLGNHALVDLVRSLRIRSRLYGQASLAATGELAPSAHEHVDLLALVQAGDRRGSERLMRRHIGHVRGSWAGHPARDAGDHPPS
ncbi:GntR family transcriptional regulator [Jatrophihabitans sp. YIM 134969]